MILLDTNVLIYAFDRDSPFCQWAQETIADAVAGDGAAINAVSLAELCVGDANRRLSPTGSAVGGSLSSTCLPPRLPSVPRPIGTTGSGAWYSPRPNANAAASGFFHWRPRPDYGVGPRHRGCGRFQTYFLRSRSKCPSDQ